MSTASELPGVPSVTTGQYLGQASPPRSLVGLVRVSPARQADEVPFAASPSVEADGDGSSGAPPALLLTIEEAAERLQVGRCTMQALLLSGEVQSFKIGRLRRVPPSALEDYIARQMAR